MLSYALASFHPADYDNADFKLAALAEAAFRHVTFIPTWELGSALTDRITPPVERIGEAVRRALEMGFEVALTPHIDVEGYTVWRGTLEIDPLGDYARVVIEPLVERITGLPVTLTLGAELDTSLRLFPERWDELRRRVPGRVSHKLNWDFGSPGLKADWYLSSLDTLQLSFYPPVNGPLDKHFARAWRKRFSKPFGWLNRPGEAGEIGLGGLDLAQPWAGRREDILEAGGRESLQYRDLRREYFRAFLQFARKRDVPATIWSAGQYDILGLEAHTGGAHRDEELVAMLRAYNRGGPELSAHGEAAG